MNVLENYESSHSSSHIFGVRRTPWIVIQIVDCDPDSNFEKSQFTIQGCTACKGRLTTEMWKQKRRLSTLSKMFIIHFIVLQI